MFLLCHHTVEDVTPWRISVLFHIPAKPKVRHKFSMQDLHGREFCYRKDAKIIKNFTKHKENLLKIWCDVWKPFVGARRSVKKVSWLEIWWQGKTREKGINDTGRVLRFSSKVDIVKSVNRGVVATKIRPFTIFVRGSSVFAARHVVFRNTFE